MKPQRLPLDQRIPYLDVLHVVIWPLTRPWLSPLHWTADGAVCIVLCAAISFALVRGIYHLPVSKYFEKNSKQLLSFWALSTLRFRFFS